MGKLKDLSTILDNTIECGQALTVSANALRDLCDTLAQCGSALQKSAKALKSFYSEGEKPALPEKEKVEPEKTYTLEEVRAILSAKSKAGFREQVKEMITKRGVDNLTKLDASEYPSLVKEVEGLGNG